MPPPVARRPDHGSPIWGILKLLLFILIPCFVWLATNVGALDEYFQALRRRDQVRAQMDRLKSEVAALEQEKTQLEKRGFADEKAARERFRLVRPGETLVFLEWDGEAESSPLLIAR